MIKLTTALTACLAATTPATALSVTCENKGAPIELSYAGEAEGRLTLSAPFGSAELPATRRERTGPDGYTVTGISGFGRAEMRLPDREAVATCVAATRAQSKLSKIACINKTELAPEPEPVVVTITIALTPDEQPVVEINRRDEEPGEQQISADSFPGGCKITP